MRGVWWRRRVQIPRRVHKNVGNIFGRRVPRRGKAPRPTTGRVQSRRRRRRQFIGSSSPSVKVGVQAMQRSDESEQLPVHKTPVAFWTAEQTPAGSGPWMALSPIPPPGCATLKCTESIPPPILSACLNFKQIPGLLSPIVEAK